MLFLLLSSSVSAGATIGSAWSSGGGAGAVSWTTLRDLVIVTCCSTYFLG